MSRRPSCSQDEVKRPWSYKHKICSDSRNIMYAIGYIGWYGICDTSRLVAIGRDSQNKYTMTYFINIKH